MNRTYTSYPTEGVVVVVVDVEVITYFIYSAYGQIASMANGLWIKKKDDLIVVLNPL